MIEKKVAERGAYVPNHAAKVAANADFLARSNMEIREKINSKRHSLIDDSGVVKNEMDPTKKHTTMRRRKKSAGAIPKVGQDAGQSIEGGSRSGSRRPSRENVQKVSTYGSHSDDQIFYSARDSQQKKRVSGNFLLNQLTRKLICVGEIPHWNMSYMYIWTLYTWLHTPENSQRQLAGAIYDWENEESYHWALDFNLSISHMATLFSPFSDSH